MAEIFPNEGLDLVYGLAPKGGTGPANTWCALFTAYTASTVGSSAAALASWTEATFGAYTRMTISSASWGTAGTTQSGRGSGAAQVTFPTSTGTQNTINGFFIVNQLATGGGTVWFGANFDDTTAVVINTNDVIKVTPTWVYTG
jgi:hypothetical protein